MILVAGGAKGGSGKSTIATHLAIMRAQAPRDVLLVDADDQETAADFTVLRNAAREHGAGYTCIKLTGPAVRTELTRLAPKYDDIVIDAGGRDTVSQRAALVLADVLLVPFLPRSFDIWTLDAVSTLIQEIRTVNPQLRAYAFINRGDPSGTDNLEAGELLQEKDEVIYLDTPIVNRKAFGRAAALGLAVTELRPRDEKAIRELHALYEAVFTDAAGTSTSSAPSQGRA
jgi:chromosome partitioning protein